MSKHLVIGMGEVGRAIFNVLNDADVSGIDEHSGYPAKNQFDYIHVCYPFTDKFVKTTKRYIGMYLKEEGVCVIHSTVEVGTTRSIGVKAVHSPIRGVHPDLEEGIKTFVKFFGGLKAKEASKPFIYEGIEVHRTNKPENTEALKLFSTTQYGVNIILEKLIHKYCKENGLDYNIVYEVAQKTYNEGYQELGMEHVTRPMLQYDPGGIGGHCVIPNADMLDSPAADFLKDMNERFKK